MTTYPAGLDASVNGLAAAGNRIAFFTADPGASAANEIPNTGRPATTWGTTTSGVKPGSQVSAPIPAGTIVTHWGVLAAATGTGIIYSDLLRKPDGTAAPETFGNAGNILHTPTLTVANPA